MRTGRPRTLHVVLTPAEQQQLRGWRQAHSSAAGLRQRSRLILLVAQEMPITRVTEFIGMSRTQIYKWIARFQQERVAGLVAKPHGGGRPRKERPHA